MIATPANQIVTSHAMFHRVRTGPDEPKSSGTGGASMRTSHRGRNGEIAGTTSTAASAHVQMK
jgi:hypothetical protein